MLKFLTLKYTCLLTKMINSPQTHNHRKFFEISGSACKICDEKKNPNITRPNCELNRSTILSLYVPGFQIQVLVYVAKCKCIPQTKFKWIPHTYTCNVKFVGTFVLLRIPKMLVVRC